MNDKTNLLNLCLCWHINSNLKLIPRLTRVAILCKSIRNGSNDDAVKCAATLLIGWISTGNYKAAIKYINQTSDNYVNVFMTN